MLNYDDALKPAYAEMIRILSIDKSYEGFLKNAAQAIDSVKSAEKAIDNHRTLEYKKWLNSISKNPSAPKPLALNWLFLTINPKPDVTLESFMNKVRKITNSTTFADYLAVIEQRGIGETLGKGFHSHILFKRKIPLSQSKPPSEIRRDLKKSLQNFCLVNNPSCLNIQFIGNDFAIDKKLYILGIKDGEKLEKVAGDKLWRSKNSIPETLGNVDII